MNRVLLTTALAPLIWGSTYLVTATFLADLPAPLLGTLRILPAGLVLLAAVRVLPPRAWWGRVLVLALLKQGLFFALLYLAALRLPGGVAATVGAISPMLVVALALPILGTRPTARNLLLAALGFLGVALISLTSGVRLDALGLLAALGFALSNALGLLLLRRWGAPAGAAPLTQTAWELTLGGVFLLLLAAPGLSHLAGLDGAQWAALAFLAVIGTGVAQVLWQRGLNLLPPEQVSMFAPLSPAVALLLDVLVAHGQFSSSQGIGAALVLVSVTLAARPPCPTHSPRKVPA